MKISLAINSRNPVPEFMEELFRSIRGFDEVVLYIDELAKGTPAFRIPPATILIGDENARDIKDGFNRAIEETTGEWICSFCDDDFFIPEALEELLAAIREPGFSDGADIIHFPVLTGSGSWGHASPFTESEIRECNLIPHGSFFRREVWEKLGGYKTNEGTDWNFWIRAKVAGFRFKQWSTPIYFFRMETARGAWAKQVAQFGAQEIKRIVNATT